MAKTVLILIGAAAIAGAAYSYRDNVEPWAARNLPEPAAKAISQIVAMLPGRSHGDAATDTRGAESKGKEQSGAPPSKKGGAGGAAPVTVAVAQTADMPIILSAPGTVEALATVAIKPRVDGTVVEVGFKEGDLVTEGSVLYRLDDRLVRAQIRQAEATIDKDQAGLKDAMSILDRRETLLNKKYASEASTETARQQVEVLKASIAASTALLEIQKTQLDYLTIRAPITGRTGSINARLGSFIRSADPTALVTINQTKPIAVTFALPQVSLDALRHALVAKSPAIITVHATKPFKVQGLLNFVDNQIDKQTGTVTAKATVENADEALWPGLSVVVDLTVETKRSVVTVPASAVQPAQQGMIAWVLSADNRVSVRTVVVDRTIDQTTFLSDGLKPGDRVVTDGQLRLSPGMAVIPRDIGGGAPDQAKGAGQGKGGGQGKGAKGGGESKGGQGKAGEAKSGEAKNGDAKSGESKAPGADASQTGTSSKRGNDRS